MTLDFQLRDREPPLRILHGPLAQNPSPSPVWHCETLARRLPHRSGSRQETPNPQKLPKAPAEENPPVAGLFVTAKPPFPTHSSLTPVYRRESIVAAMAQ